MTDTSKAIVRAVILALDTAERKGIRTGEGLELRAELVPAAQEIRVTVRDSEHQVDVAFCERTMKDMNLTVRL